MPSSGLPVRAVEQIHPARLVRLGDAFARLAVDREIEQHDGIAAVVVPEVVMNLLVVPAVRARLHVERHDRRREQVVALAHGAVEVGARVRGGEVEEAELGVDGRRLPHGAAAVLPDVVVLRPGLVAALARARDRVEGPEQLAVLRVVRLHAAAHAALRTREAADQHPVVVERRARDREAFLPALRLDRPDDGARSSRRAPRSCRRAGLGTPCRRRPRRRDSSSCSTPCRPRADSPCSSRALRPSRRRSRTRRSRPSRRTRRRSRRSAAPSWNSAGPRPSRRAARATRL